MSVLLVTPVCLECGKPVEVFSNGKGHKTCSKKCALRRNARIRGRESIAFIACVCCGKQFHRRKPTQTTCSDCGSVEWIGCYGCGLHRWRLRGKVGRPYCTFRCSQDTQKRVGVEVAYLRGLAENGVRTHLCTMCGTESPCKMCSDECRREHGRLRSRDTHVRVEKTWHVCEQDGCSGVIYGHAGRRFCFMCIKDRERAQARELRRGVSATNRSRCRRFGVEYDHSVTRQAVLKRDGMRCCCCGRTVIDGGGDSTLDNYAEIDHIIPLSKGMLGHTWDNVQTLCRVCNAEKSDNMPLQWEEANPLWVMVQTA